MKHEQYEWVNVWKENANDKKKKRILLIGDSITNGYYEFVKNNIDGYLVDKLTTSYAVDDPAFLPLLQNALLGYKYVLIHFNNGLHGKHLSSKIYHEKMERAIESLSKKANLILAETTQVTDITHSIADEEWSSIIIERNKIAQKICANRKLSLNELYDISLKITEHRHSSDGFHYTEKGYEILAAKVVATIKSQL